jgi:hypothetical protein
MNDMGIIANIAATMLQVRDGYNNEARKNVFSVCGWTMMDHMDDDFRQIIVEKYTNLICIISFLSKTLIVIR